MEAPGQLSSLPIPKSGPGRSIMKDSEKYAEELGIEICINSKLEWTIHLLQREGKIPPYSNLCRLCQS